MRRLAAFFVRLIGALMSGLTGLFVARDDDNNGTTPVGARKALAGLLQWKGPNPLDVQPGVLVDDLSPIVAGTSGMSYDVRAFAAVVVPSDAIGPIIAANDALQNVLTTAAPGSNSRIDVIWCRQHLVPADGGADDDVEFEIGVTQGSAAASPVVPDIPDDALALYKVTVPTGTIATNTLTFTRLHEWVGTRNSADWKDWTPEAVVGATTADFDVDVARYARVGDVVHCYVRLTVNTNGIVLFTIPVPGSGLIFFATGTVVLGIDSLGEVVHSSHALGVQSVILNTTTAPGTPWGLTASFTYEAA